MQYSDKGLVGEGTITVPIGRLLKRQLGKHWQNGLVKGIQSLSHPERASPWSGAATRAFQKLAFSRYRNLEETPTAVEKCSGVCKAFSFSS